MRIQGIVGNEFITPEASLNVSSMAITPPIPQTVPVIPLGKRVAFSATEATLAPRASRWEQVINLFQTHSIVVFSLLILAIAVAAAPIVSNSLTANFKFSSTPTVKHPRALSGINVAVPRLKLQSWLSALTSQPASLNLGSSTVIVSPNTIRNWLRVSLNTAKSEYNVHVNASLMSSSLTSLANKYTVTPINQVTATRDDGSSEVVVAGRNGAKLIDPASITTQAEQLSRNLFDNKGFQINSPLVSLPFANVTPSSFNKLLLVDVNSKKMYAYQDGQLVQTFLVSAGASTTPTPIGEFHIYAKLTVQDMSGYNTNGTKYLQPHVRWINYFDGSDAVHGVYWHPLSWFGARNSSHGCVGIPEDQAQWIYNWAPVGTTVITTPN